MPAAYSATSDPEGRLKEALSCHGVTFASQLVIVSGVKKTDESQAGKHRGEVLAKR
jgi:hypothetical protein